MVRMATSNAFIPASRLYRWMVAAVLILSGVERTLVHAQTAPVLHEALPQTDAGPTLTREPAAGSVPQPAVKLTGIRTIQHAPGAQESLPTEEGVVATPLPESSAGTARRYHLEAGWEEGLHLDSADNDFHIHVGGNAQVDTVWYLAPNSAFLLPNNNGVSGVGNAQGTQIRRTRFRFEGDIFDQFNYIVEYDLANASNETNGLQAPSFSNIATSPAPCNVWMQVRDLPVGSVRLGNQVKPVGFTNQVYQGFLPFMEREAVFDAIQAPFDNGFALGVTARDHTDDQRITWQYGIYSPAVNVFGIALNKFEWGGRVTALPVYEDEGRLLVHVGLGTLNGELPENQLRVRARPLLRNAPGYAVPVLVDTGTRSGSRQYTVAPEFAAVLGRWTFQAEWNGQWLTEAIATNGQNQGTVLYQGGYAQILYFVTGEYQPYDRNTAAFGRVIPQRNFRMKRGEGCTGCGAWQVGVRLGYVDLNDRAIQGGRLNNCTVGVNWFLNPNMKLQFNYILDRRDQPGVPAAWINGIGWRAAYDF